MFKRLLIFVGVLLALIAMAIPFTARTFAHAATVQDVSGWSISKTVDGSHYLPLHMFKGDTATAYYKITLTGNNDSQLPVTVADTNGCTFTIDEKDGLTSSGCDFVNFSGAPDGPLVVTYTKIYTCDTDGIATGLDHPNTATIDGDGPHASTNVRVYCYDLTVTKTAETLLTRTYDWSIAKTADQNNLTLPLNQSATVNYKVAVSATPKDSDWAVKGTITIHNPAPMDATINSVADILPGSSDLLVKCPDARFTDPYTLHAGDSLVCSYSADLPDGTLRTNTATAELQNYDRSDGKSLIDSTTDFSGTASVDFSPTGLGKLKEKDTSINVTDTFAGTLGQVTFGTDTLPKTFSYSRLIGPYTTSGAQSDVLNTATFVVVDDTETTGSSSWTVHVMVVAEPQLPKTGSSPTVA